MEAIALLSRCSHGMGLEAMSLVTEFFMVFVFGFLAGVFSLLMFVECMERMGRAKRDRDSSRKETTDG